MKNLPKLRNVVLVLLLVLVMHQVITDPVGSAAVVRHIVHGGH